MVTPSECCVNGMLSGGVFPTGIIHGVFSTVTHCCVCGSKRIRVGTVGVHDSGLYV